MVSKILILSAFAASALAQNTSTIIVNTPPSLIECQPVDITWSGGQEPYIIAAIPGGQVSAPALENIASGVTGNSYTWTVNLAEGTSVTIKLTDATGAIQYSSPDTIQAGASASCLTSSSNSASSAQGTTIATTGASSGGATATQAASSTSGDVATTSAPDSSGTAATDAASTASSKPASSSASTPRAGESSSSSSASASASKSAASPAVPIGGCALALTFFGSLLATL